MAHDELLFIVNSEQYMNSRTKETPYFALRAVVELHQPNVIPDWVPTENEYICEGCTRVYPCPTIKALERELA